MIICTALVLILAMSKIKLLAYKRRERERERERDSVCMCSSDIVGFCSVLIRIPGIPDRHQFCKTYGTVYKILQPSRLLCLHTNMWPVFLSVCVCI